MAIEWTERNKMGLVIGVAVAVNLVLGYFLWSAMDTLDEKNKGLRGERDKRRRLDEHIASGPLKQQELETNEVRFKSQLQCLPQKEGLTKLIDQISAIGAKHKVECKNVTLVQSVAPPTANDPYVPSRWQTTWEASYFNWFAFMHEMEEHFDRFVAFENLGMTVQNHGMLVTNNAKHSFTVDIVTYRYAPPAP